MFSGNFRTFEEDSDRLFIAQRMTSASFQKYPSPSGKGAPIVIDTYWSVAGIYGKKPVSIVSLCLLGFWFLMSLKQACETIYYGLQASSGRFTRLDHWPTTPLRRQSLYALGK